MSLISFLRDALQERGVTVQTLLMFSEDIARAILVLHRQRVILDADLAALYGVTTKRLNEQVKRNAARFPGDFMFRLSGQETTVISVPYEPLSPTVLRTKPGFLNARLTAR